MNMFKNLMGGMNGVGSMTSGDIPGTLELVESKFSLTSYTHPPVMRRHDINPNPLMLEQLALEKASCNVSPATVNNIAIKSSTLSATHTGIAPIQGGWNEFNRGIGVLKFRIKTGGIDEVYINVLGYISGNSAPKGLDDQAWFIPVHSWKTHNQLTNGVGLGGDSTLEQTIGMKTDFIGAGGSISNQGLRTIRPVDVVTTTSMSIGREETEKYVKEITNGTGVVSSPAQVNNFTPSSSMVDANGVIYSKRSNYNPTEYAKEIFIALVNSADEQTRAAGAVVDNPFTTVGHKSLTNVLGNVSSTMMSAEPSNISNEFALSIRNHTGSTITGRGIQICEIAQAYPNFPNTMPKDINGNPSLTLLDRDHVEVYNMADITEVFGTSNIAEIISQAIIFNILDAMSTRGVNSIVIEGSNCDLPATTDMLSNIQMFPANTTTLKDFDLDVNKKGIEICETLKREIFNYYNGTSQYNITPMRWKIEAELLGLTAVWITPMDPTNPNPKQFYFSFPTYVPSPFSPILTDQTQLHTLSNGVFQNMKNYLFN